VSAERIPIPEVPSFLERFSRGHRGWLTKVERFEPTRRGEIDSRERALGGIVPDPARNGVLVFLDDGPGGSVAYDIEKADELWRDSFDRGVRLEISSGDGSTTIVECHPVGQKASLETLLERRVT
jgi:hypothetical protein